MAEVDWEPRQFRRWLVRKLADTRWTGWGKDGTIEELARNLGVQPDVLLDAQRYVRSRTERGTAIAGLEPIKMRRDGQRATLGRNATIHLAVPLEIKQAWDVYRDLGKYTDSVLLRSIIHYGLLRPTQPYWVGRGWPYRGKTYHCDGWNKLRCTERDWPWVVVTRISSGAQAALIRRAGATRIAIRGFVRGLVIDLLDGRIQSFDTVTEASQMFEADRYHMLEGTLEDRALKQQLDSRRKL